MIQQMIDFTPQEPIRLSDLKQKLMDILTETPYKTGFELQEYLKTMEICHTEGTISRRLREMAEIGLVANRKRKQGEKNYVEWFIS